MKKLAMVLLSALPLFAQGLPGTWQGTLKVPQAPRGANSVSCSTFQPLKPMR
jgi:hypothetical protein